MTIGSYKKKILMFLIIFKYIGNEIKGGDITPLKIVDEKYKRMLFSGKAS